jgi:hypothetical protein
MAQMEKKNKRNGQSNVSRVTHVNKIFEDWNIERYELFSGNEPYVFRRTKNSTDFYFKGVSKKLTLSISKCGRFSVWVANRKKFIDIVHDNDIVIEQTSKGRYYCGLCIPKYRKYFHSLDKLVVSHCALPLLTWVQENFKPSLNLLIIKCSGFSYAKILNGKDLRKHEKKMQKNEYKKYPDILRVVAPVIQPRSSR